jgi:hypothetical protein
MPPVLDGKRCARAPHIVNGAAPQGRFTSATPMVLLEFSVAGILLRTLATSVQQGHAPGVCLVDTLAHARTFATSCYANVCDLQGQHA